MLFNPTMVNFVSFYQFSPIYNYRNVDKMTYWETCFKAYTISNIQKLPGLSSPGPPPGLCLDPLGASGRPQTPSNFNSWTRP
jgi:hypothetical protein